ncbi:MAG: transcriptional regulator [Actinomycetota bacterium]|nr:transcriptional regulator [Actinomycetota bacterium]
MESPLDDVAAVAALNEPVRSRLYSFVRRQGEPVSREAAAADSGISVNLAAFHLDKLVDVGLLNSHYGRLPDAPPQRGRSPKLYQVGDREITASLPPRRYDLSGEILLDAIETRRDRETTVAAVLRAANARGRRLGGQVRSDRRAGGPRSSSFDLAQRVLEEQGFEPYFDESSTLRLRNCPFHRLAQRSPELICSMNHAFIEGLLRGFGDDDSQVELAPRAGQCCVAISEERNRA